MDGFTEFISPVNFLSCHTASKNCHCAFYSESLTLGDKKVHEFFSPDFSLSTPIFAIENIIMN